MTGNQSYAFDTRVIHSGEAPDPATGAHGVPLYQNSTYAFRSYDQVEQFQAGFVPHFIYARGGNPTVRCFELKMADLEGAEAAAATANGMAAITATLMELVCGGGHLVVASNVYSYTGEFFRTELPAIGVEATAVDITDLAAVGSAMRNDTRAVYCETYSNPLMHVADLPAIAEIAHRHGAKVVVDNTFLSPALLRPLELGVDVVVHSATKYLAGTGQVMGGVVSGPRNVIDGVNARLDRNGGRLTPFAAWLLLAGVKTLPLRMERHCASAQAIAELLASDDAVSLVRYPGLDAHPGHAAAARMCGSRHGGLLTFEFRAGEPAVRAFTNALELATIAVSLGEASTLVWPNGGGQVRLAVGLEDTDDLLDDVGRGLRAAREVTGTIGH